MMKLLNKRQKNNGGFSLVELIVVIAIMVVLVAVLAPVFVKYIESSRKSTDVSTAASIKTAVETAYSDETTKDKIATGAWTEATSNIPNLKENPEVQSKDHEGEKFFYIVDTSNNDVVKVAVAASDSAAASAPDLSTSDGADEYKNPTTSTNP